MNPNDATNEELRDWLAIRLGWTRTDILAAVYAAIAEVKRAQASTANP